MKNSALLIFIIASWCISASAESSMTKYSVKTKKYETVKVSAFEGVEVTADCASKKSKNCLAIAAIKKSQKNVLASGELFGHPAAKYCHVLGAENIILLDSQKNEFDYCSFKDGSVAEAWALYNRHHK